MAMDHRIIEILEKGGLVAIPTDTIYGLVGNPFSKTSVDRAYELKNRDRSKKFSIFLDDRNKITDICATNSKVEKFIENELKNNTIVLQKKDKNYLHLISDDTLGIRIPDNEFIINLLKVYGKPIFATSINLSGEKECLTYGEIVKNFSDKIELIVEGEVSCTNRPSSIFRFENNEIVKLR